MASVHIAMRCDDWDDVYRHMVLVHDALGQRVEDTPLASAAIALEQSQGVYHVTVSDVDADSLVPAKDDDVTAATLKSTFARIRELNIPCVAILTGTSDDKSVDETCVFAGTHAARKSLMSGIDAIHERLVWVKKDPGADTADRRRSWQLAYAMGIADSLRRLRAHQSIDITHACGCIGVNLADASDKACVEKRLIEVIRLIVPYDINTTEVVRLSRAAGMDMAPHLEYAMPNKPDAAMKG